MLKSPLVFGVLRPDPVFLSPVSSVNRPRRRLHRETSGIGGVGGVGSLWVSFVDLAGVGAFSFMAVPCFEAGFFCGFPFMAVSCFWARCFIGVAALAGFFCRVWFFIDFAFIAARPDGAAFFPDESSKLLPASGDLLEAPIVEVAEPGVMLGEDAIGEVSLGPHWPHLPELTLGALTFGLLAVGCNIGL